jgi:hypothetical protein
MTNEQTKTAVEACLAKTKHTPEPWHYNVTTNRVWADTYEMEKYKGNDAVIAEVKDYHMSGEEADANGVRLAACVNACKNVSNEWLQENAVNALIERARDNERRDANHIANLELQLDELKELLSDIANSGDTTMLVGHWERARKLLEPKS